VRRIILAEIQVRVVPPPERIGELSSEALLERFETRVDELGESIGQIARRLRTRLDSDLAEDDSQAWSLDEVTVTFSLDLEAEAGVVVARARTTAGFEIELTWKRS
jgi:Trypsin-co-occurring domain 1